MSYQALYRKWRPEDFDSVRGQDTIVKTLKNQITAGRIGHAYLFCGTRGTGKTSVAKIFAKAVNCEHPIDGNPCGECAVCAAIAAGTSMNVIEIDAASNNGVDNIREIREEVRYSPTEGKYKVYIIDEVHMLSIGAFNALLKTLEEPPSYVIFILATTEAAKIPITILSRCQRYDFRRISIDTIADRLSELMQAENIRVEDKALKYVAKAADGSMRDALSLLDQCIAFYLGRDLKYENVLEVLGAVDTSVFSRMLKVLMAGNVPECMQMIEELVMQGRDLTQFVSDFIWYLRNILLIKTTDNIETIEDVIEVSKDNLADLKEDANSIDTESIMRFIRIFSDLASELKFSTQKRIKTEVALIKLMRPAMEQSRDYEDIVSRISILENRVEDALNRMAAGKIFVADTFTQAENREVQQQQVVKRVYDAVPEDVKEIAHHWSDIIASVEDPLLKQCLTMSHVTLAEDNKSLEIMVESLLAYEKLSQKETLDMLEAFVEERTGISVRIFCTRLDEGEDFHRKYVDLSELVGMEIVIDDKEEFI